MEISSMNYWIFKCNRKFYRLDARLNAPEQNTTWRVKQYKKDVHLGDIAFIWQTSPDPGLRAVMHITSDPTEMEEIETEKQYYIPDFEPTHIVRVTGTLQDRFPLLSIKGLKRIPELNSLSALYPPPGTNHKVTHAEGKFLMDYIKAHVPA